MFAFPEQKSQKNVDPLVVRFVMFISAPTQLVSGKIKFTTGCPDMVCWIPKRMKERMNN
jgi:hypothetical protein